MVLTTAAACILRFFQLTDFTDANTGEVVEGSSIALYIYGVLFFALICAGVYAFFSGKKARAFDIEACGKRIAPWSALLAAAFFADFLYQAYSCYEYISGTAYIEYSYIGSRMVSAAAEVLCSFYFIAFTMTAKGENYDIRNLTWLHFAPVLWGLARLAGIMVKIIDISRSTETVLEFFFLVFFF